MNRLEQLKEFVKESPQDPFLYYAITMEYLKLGDVQKTREGFEYLVSQYPNYVGTYYHFGKFLEKSGEVVFAESIYLQGVTVAKAARNMHAAGELQGALNLLKGFDDEEDDY